MNPTARSSDGPGRAESWLLSQLRRGTVVDLRPLPDGAGAPSPASGIAAAAISRVVLAVTTPAPGRVPRLHVRGAHITGALLLGDATIQVPLAFEECEFDEPLDLSHAKAKSLSLRGCVIPALAAPGLRLDADLDLSAAQIGGVNLFGATIGGQVLLTDARVRAPASGWAIRAPQMTAVGGLYCRRLEADGGVNLWGAEIGTSLDLAGATLTADDRVALRAPNLTVRADLHLTTSQVRGRIDLFGATIGGQVWLTDARVRATGQGWAISAPQMTVVGGLYCRRLEADGGVNLWGAQIGAAVELLGAALTATDRPALRAVGVRVKGDLDLTDATLNGTIDLNAATVDGQMTTTDAVLRADQQPALTLATARLGTLRLGTITGSHLGIDLRGAAVTHLHDDPATWPDQLWLDRLSYHNLRPHLPANQRLAWLRRDPEPHHPQPYEQLASHYRSTGQDSDARTVLLAKHRIRRRQLNRPARLWGYLQDAAVGYGYRPTRALGWLILLIAVLTLVAIIQPPHPTSPQAPPFHPLIYAVDVVLPVLDLGQQKAYTPSGTGQWITWIATLSAWTLASTVIAAITRTVARD